MAEPHDSDRRLAAERVVVQHGQTVAVQLNGDQRASTGGGFRGGQLEHVPQNGELISLEIDVLKTVQRSQRPCLHIGDGVVLQVELEQRGQGREHAPFHLGYVIVLQPQLPELVQL